MTPSFMPKRLLIIGAGAIGVEFASFYRSMGSDVTLIEMMQQILPAEDHRDCRNGEKLFYRAGH